MGEESSPTHDVFLSYSSKDKTWADAACAVLERHRVRCWIAPRDITPGEEWGAAIIRGLNGSRMMVLIFSGHANASGQVRREVERAISRGMTILGIRVEDVRPEGAMEFALGSMHLLDALTPPVERHLEKLAQYVNTCLRHDVESPAVLAQAKPAAVGADGTAPGSHETGDKPAKTTSNRPMETASVISVFVSYRREDSRHQAGRLYDHLMAHFGKGRVFKDVDSIPLGLDFREVLTERVAGCDVFLAVIGDEWLSIAGKSGTRRLDDPGDFVRIEIEAALSRKIPVIPVLVGNSSVPRAEDLPESLQKLAFRNGLCVRPDPDFHNDVDRLIRGINEVHSALQERSAPRGPKTVAQEDLKSAGLKSSDDGQTASSTASRTTAAPGGAGSADPSPRSVQPRLPGPGSVKRIEPNPVVLRERGRGVPVVEHGESVDKEQRSAAGRAGNEKRGGVSSIRARLFALDPATGAAAVHTLDRAIGLFNIAVGLLAPAVLSFALYMTLGVPTKTTWSGNEIAVVICILTGIALGVDQINAGRLLLRKGASARKPAIRHAIANVAVLILFYLFGLMFVPKIESIYYALPIFIVVGSCLYPAAVWILLSLAGTQTNLDVAPKTHPRD